jgi:stage V sporulation protein SpoVS
MAGEGPLAAEVINTIKHAISLANGSCPELGGQLRVGTAHLSLKIVADSVTGIRVPSADLAVKDSGVLTHTLDLTVVPADNDLDAEPGAGNSGSALVAAINAARRAVAMPAGFVLTAASITLSFAVSGDGDLLLGGNGDAGAAVTHALALTLVP